MTDNFLAMNNPDIKKLVSDPSFIRWTRGRASAQERTYWDGWLMKSKENRELAKKAQAEITGFMIHPADAPNSKVAWYHLQNRLAENQTGHSLNRKNLRMWNGRYTRVAAVFLIAVLAGLLINQMNFTGETSGTSEMVQEVETASGELKTLTFSDGSEVILNGNSRIRYTVHEDDLSTIEVHLTGEAHFSVTDRSQTHSMNPFRLHTDAGIIEVLGTRFVVSALQNRTQVVLEEGSLSLRSSHQEIETVLQPGQLGKLVSAQGEVSVRQVNTALYSSWIHGRLEFNQAKIEDVTDRLEDLFDVQIEIRDQTILEKRVTGSIEDDDLDVILLALSKMLDTPVYAGDNPDLFYFGEP